MACLRFIILDCYGDLHARADPRSETYRSHLARRIAGYMGTLPEIIAAE